MTNLLLASLSMIILGMTTNGEWAMEYPNPPEMPKSFNSVEEVEKYLTLLQQYYTVLGRPRFGKRSVGSGHHGGEHRSGLESKIFHKREHDQDDPLDLIFTILDANEDGHLSRAEFHTGIAEIAEHIEKK